MGILFLLLAITILISTTVALAARNKSKTKKHSVLKPNRVTIKNANFEKSSGITQNDLKPAKIETPQNPIFIEPLRSLNPFEIGRTSNLQVDYDCASAQSTVYEFPYLRIPVKGTQIRYPKTGKTGRKGITEKSFFDDYVRIRFVENAFNDLILLTSFAGYEPDIAVISHERKNIFIDLEIDEPYDGVDRHPLHYLDDDGAPIDMARNDDFIDNGWIILRFSERQIKETPQACCDYIYSLCQFIIGELSFLDIGSLGIRSEKIWTRNDAIEMAKANTRESYLGIKNFGKTDSASRIYNLNEKESFETFSNNRSVVDEMNIELVTTNSLAEIKKFTNSLSLGPALKSTNASTPIQSKPVLPQGIGQPKSNAKISTLNTDKPSTPAPRPYATK